MIKLKYGSSIHECNRCGRKLKSTYPPEEIDSVIVVDDWRTKLTFCSTDCARQYAIEVKSLMESVLELLPESVS